MSVFFSRFMGNESQCGTNKSREPRSGSRAICLFRTAIHFPWTEKKRLQFTRFVCSALRFISREPRKKDRSSRDLFVPHCDSFSMNREKKIAVHASCLFRTAIHFPWTEKKRSQFTRVVCSALRFISHEARKKTLIPYIYHASNKDPF